MQRLKLYEDANRTRKHQIEDLNERLQKQEMDITKVSRGTKIFEDHSKRFQQLSKEIHAIAASVRSSENNFTVGMEKNEAAMERIDRRFETELNKF